MVLMLLLMGRLLRLLEVLMLLLLWLLLRLLGHVAAAVAVLSSAQLVGTWQDRPHSMLVVAICLRVAVELGASLGRLGRWQWP